MIITHVAKTIADILEMFSLSDCTVEITAYISGEEKTISFVHVIHGFLVVIHGR